MTAQQKQLREVQNKCFQRMKRKGELAILLISARRSDFEQVQEYSCQPDISAIVGINAFPL